MSLSCGQLQLVQRFQYAAGVPRDIFDVTDNLEDRLHEAVSTTDLKSILGLRGASHSWQASSHHVLMINVPNWREGPQSAGCMLCWQNVVYCASCLLPVQCMLALLCLRCKGPLSTTLMDCAGDFTTRCVQFRSMKAAAILWEKANKYVSAVRVSAFNNLPELAYTETSSWMLTGTEAEQSRNAWVYNAPVLAHGGGVQSQVQSKACKVACTTDAAFVCCMAASKLDYRQLTPPVVSAARGRKKVKMSSPTGSLLLAKMELVRFGSQQHLCVCAGSTKYFKPISAQCTAVDAFSSTCDLFQATLARAGHSIKADIVQTLQLLPETVEPKLFFVVGTQLQFDNFQYTCPPFYEELYEEPEQSCPGEPDEAFWKAESPTWLQVPSKARKMLRDITQHVMFLNYERLAYHNELRLCNIPLLL